MKDIASDIQTNLYMATPLAAAGDFLEQHRGSKVRQWKQQ